jgi:hypothetical protein
MISDTVSLTMYRLPSTGVSTVSGVASTRSIGSQFSATLGPCSRVTMIMALSVGSRRPELSGYSSQSRGDMRRLPLRSLASARSMDSHSSWTWRCTACSSAGSHQSSSRVRTRSWR